MDDSKQNNTEKTCLGQWMSQEYKPGLVSVIIPTYNRAWSLGKSVRSVFDQTYRPIECIIVDDGSTDDTSSVVKTLVDECPEGVTVRYFKQENSGANSARNHGLKECRGDFICYLDSDDMLTCGSIGERARILIENPNVDFCYGSCSVRDENGRELERMNKPWPADGEARISSCLFYSNSPLIRRAICCKAGLWREDLHGNQDYEYFSRIKYFSEKVCFIDKVVDIYIKHNGRHICDKSLSYSLSFFKSILIVKSLVLYGKYDNMQERDCLALRFRTSAKRLYLSKAYADACAALRESMGLKWNVKVFAQWLVVRLLAVCKSENHNVL